MPNQNEVSISQRFMDVIPACPARQGFSIA